MSRIVIQGLSLLSLRRHLGDVGALLWPMLMLWWLVILLLGSYPALFAVCHRPLGAGF